MSLNGHDIRESEMKNALWSGHYFLIAARCSRQLVNLNWTDASSSSRDRLNNPEHWAPSEPMNQAPEHKRKTKTDREKLEAWQMSEAERQRMQRIPILPASCQLIGTVWYQRYPYRRVLKSWYGTLYKWRPSLPLLLSLPLKKTRFDY